MTTLSDYEDEEKEEDEFEKCRQCTASNLPVSILHVLRCLISFVWV